MLSQHFGQVVFGAFLSFMVFGLICEQNIMKPFGPKMCHRFCSHIVGCSSYLFIPSDSSCHLSNVTSLQYAPETDIYLFNVMKNKEILFAEKYMMCGKNSEIYHTRRNILQCSLRGNEASKEHDKTKKVQGRRSTEFTRILMLPFSSMGRSEQGRQLFLHNNSIFPYRYLKGQFYAVAYIYTLKKLIVGEKRELFSLLLDDGNKRMLARMRVETIAVDESKENLFVTTFIPWKGVSKMTVGGKKQTSIVRSKTKVTGIAVDPKRSHIYVIRGDRHIVRFTYEGIYLASVFHGKFKGSLHLDTSIGVLYSMTNIPLTIWKMTLSNSDISSAFHLNFTTENIFVIKDTFYFTSRDYRGGLIVISKSGAMTKYTHGFKTCDLYMCAIP